MADDKRFEATQSRLARARRDGDVARSHDLTAVVSLAAAALAAFAVLEPLSAAIWSALAAAAPPSVPSAGPYIAIAACALGTVVAALAGALLATYVQTRTFVFKAPSLELAKLNPAQGLKRMLGRDAAVAAAKATVASAVVAAAVAAPVAGAFVSGRAAVPAALAELSLHAVQTTFAGAVVVAFAFALGDALLERTKWLRRLRMSFDELKRDHKQSEGDPMLRGRRRQRHRALVRGALARVREAAFVVANPTHVAIALEYRPPEVAVPRVLVRAVDAGALEVRRLAREHRVPIVENVSLARALLAAVDVGDFIPPDAYGAVAAIVASLARQGALAR